MPLPFTHDAFLDVFAAYNDRLWPAVAILWLLSLGAVVHLYRRGPAASRLIAALLALHWAWSGAVYHLVFFRSINPAAALFGATFLLEATLITWRGVVRRQLTFTPSKNIWSRLGAGLIVYALAYPVLGLLLGLVYPRLPLFAVPCPTTILTAGLLLIAPRREARILAVVPVLWCAVGGSAAFVLGMRADLALIVSGVLVLAYVLRPVRHPQPGAA